MSESWITEFRDSPDELVVARNGGLISNELPRYEKLPARRVCLEIHRVRPARVLCWL